MNPVNKLESLCFDLMLLDWVFYPFSYPLYSREIIGVWYVCISVCVTIIYWHHSKSNHGKNSRLVSCICMIYRYYFKHLIRIEPIVHCYDLRCSCIWELIKVSFKDSRFISRRNFWNIQIFSPAVIHAVMMLSTLSVVRQIPKQTKHRVYLFVWL